MLQQSGSDGRACAKGCTLHCTGEACARSAHRVRQAECLIFPMPSGELMVWPPGADGAAPLDAALGTVPEVRLGFGAEIQPVGRLRKQRLRPSFLPHVKAPQPGVYWQVLQGRLAHNLRTAPSARHKLGKYRRHYSWALLAAESALASGWAPGVGRCHSCRQAGPAGPCKLAAAPAAPCSLAAVCGGVDALLLAGWLGKVAPLIVGALLQ